MSRSKLSSIILTYFSCSYFIRKPWEMLPTKTMGVDIVMRMTEAPPPIAWDRHALARHERFIPSSE